MVKELVDPLTLTWDHDKLQRFFTPLDAEVISSIPLTTRGQNDFWAWHYEKAGVFSVRSAYRMLVQKKENLTAWLEHTPSTSDIRANEKEWTAIWQLKVPPKIKVFLWRLARHSIPTADVLHRRHIAPHAACLVCGVPDSWKHSLLECNLAKCVWALMNEETVEHICNVEEQNAKAWLAEIISSLPKEESRRVVVTMWAVWHAKRKAVYENIFQSPLSTHCFVDRFMSDLDLSSPQSEITASKGRVPRWIPPPGGIVKINVDAALSKNSRGASAAAVARDASGKFMGASSVVMRGIIDPETMEVLALREGLALAKGLSLNRVRMASNCANAVRCMTGGSTMGAYGQIIQELREDAKAFLVMEFVHERREANHDAHVLARSTLASSFGRYAWFFDPPDGVCNSYLVT